MYRVSSFSVDTSDPSYNAAKPSTVQSTACGLPFSPVSPARRFVPRAVDEKDVEYARPGGKALLLDLHVPDGAGPFPAAILIHGGGFDEGSKSTNPRPLMQPLADAGFAWFSIDYRLAPAAHLAEGFEDMQSAIRFVKANAASTTSIPRRSC